MRPPLNNPLTELPTAFGLVAWLEQTRILLPLKGVECAFDVRGDVVSVELDQIFHQNTTGPLDCLYTFPLPAGAAVYRCEMHINGRVIRAKVEERERARELAREHKAAGFRTALVEMERDNLFTLSLGNVQPDEVIVIRFAWFQTLTRLADWTSFHIPFCPGVRYIPGTPLLRASIGRGAADDTDQVPDASRITPPRIDRLHPDAAYLWVRGNIAHPQHEVQDLSSPSHPVLVRPGGDSSSVTIADRAAVPDGDFILRWTELLPAEVIPMGWWTRAEAGDFALVRLRAPADCAASDTYAQDVFFLLDRSGSMKGLKWSKAAQAFQEFVKALGDQDRVWATFFESGVRDLAEKPLPPREVLADPSVQKLESLGTAGGTELLPAIEHVLSKIALHSNTRPKSLVLITDGEVGNEAQVLQRLASDTNLRVHVFGIDVAINDGFLQKLAAQHDGSSCLLSPNDDIVGAVVRLGARLRRPVLTAIRIPEGWELAGQEQPELHAGEVLSLPLRRNTPSGEKSEPPCKVEVLTFVGELPDHTSQEFRFELAATSSVALPLLWAKKRIDFLLAKGETQAALELAKVNNLVCEGAAFIAWDEMERVPVSGPDQEVYQPVMMAGFCGAPTAAPLYQLRGKLMEEALSPQKPRVARLARMVRDTDPALDPLVQLERICDEAGHPEWLAKCGRVIEWASGDAVQQLCRKQRRPELARLIESLKADAVVVGRVFAKLKDSLLRVTGERVAANRSPLGIPEHLRLFNAEARQRLHAALDQTSALHAEISTLIAELTAAEQQMEHRLDEFLRRHVEKTAAVA